MAEHTTFRVGGPADIYAVPAHQEDVRKLIACANAESLPLFVLGGGANILVADAGIRGLVMDMSSFHGIEETGVSGNVHEITVGAGMPVSDASAWAADRGLAGLAFIYAMPGSVAGAVWMNARCYGGEIHDVLAFVDFVDQSGKPGRYTPRPDEFAYKRSPFQDNRRVMTRVGFRLQEGTSTELWKAMREHEQDRKAKGHFAAPCAGSVFKNNRDFGAPSGVILDKLGLRGFTIGGARVSEQHANIVINAHNATAADIRRVIEHMESTARQARGIALEREVLFVGDWGDHDQ
jgi:UDP-N-acetylmuramate dehydrogenase